MRRKTCWAGIVAASLLAIVPAKAQTIADAGHLKGADRTQALIAGAKKEGSLTLYSSVQVPVATDLSNAFTAKYGVRISLWRGGSGDILQRATTEARGGRFAADVMETAGPEMEAASRAKLLVPVESPETAALMAGAYVPARPWIATRLTVLTLAYNTRAVAPADAPKSYEDLLNPKWKGKLGVEVDDSNWLMSVADVLGEQNALTLFRTITKTNGVSLRKGHSLLANLTASGEVPVALDAYYDGILDLQRAGAPIQAVFAKPVVAMPTAVGVFAHAPHPYAAMLFVDFLLSEDGQKILAKHNIVPTNLKVQKLPQGMVIEMMDIPKYIDQSAKWTAAFKDVFARAH